jgi:hypothetical protein
MPEFDRSSYLDRYGILCGKLIRERLYTACTAIWTERARKNDVRFGSINEALSFDNFAKSYTAYLKGRIGEFEE